MKAEVAVLGLSVPNNPYGLCGPKATLDSNCNIIRAQELCESGGGRPGLPVPNSPDGFRGRKATLNLSPSEFSSCVKVEVAVLGSPSLTVLVVSVDVKQP